ncbi:hypothetical protein N658DRAFT_558519 [Parathielavia hyrcaniae]|uniref:Uncharacterized protein n=1 Tax=Parathielavia hyrcaniae TaxID=113614 RepID=A0AAN6T2L5_9PEZI|nr:hypothetical protein N658DRAFT_558519 [Parathielavia hyrcaniae]
MPRNTASLPCLSRRYLVSWAVARAPSPRLFLKKYPVLAWVPTAFSCIRSTAIAFKKLAGKHARLDQRAESGVHPANPFDRGSGAEDGNLYSTNPQSTARVLGL